MRAMSKEIDKRPQSAASFSAELRGIGAILDVRAGMAGPSDTGRGGRTSADRGTPGGRLRPRKPVGIDRHRRRNRRGGRHRPRAAPQPSLVEEPEERRATLDSLRALGATLVEAVETRIELALVELREEGERRKSMLVLAVTGGFSVAGVAPRRVLRRGVFLGDAPARRDRGRDAPLSRHRRGGVPRGCARTRRTAPPPFEATLRELAADREMLRGDRE